MEWVHELLATAVLAVLLSFVVAKLVSVAMAGDDVRDPDGESGELADRAPAPGGAEVGARLSSRGPESERGVEFVRGAAAGKVDRFGDEVASAVEVVEPARCGEEEVGTERGEAAEGPPVAVELPAEPKAEEESVGASELVVEKESECRSGGAGEDDDRPSLGGKDEEPQPRVPKSAEAARAEQSEHEQERIDEKKEVLRVGGDDAGDGDGDGDGDDDDDGWEGIERSELEKKFAVAARYVDPANTDDRLESIGSDVKMQLYGLHKVATEGPCHETQPMALMVSARAKWNAWQRLGNMSPDVAMEQYISLLAAKTPDWEVAKTADENKSDVAMLKAQDCNLSTGSCDQLEYTNLRKPSMESLTGQTDMSKDENQ
ncbi:acyl-CoA-binding domain-containing protein 3 [Eucalyptus grandis]|uniref:acyl-CoA-binding domain-containing protein 3 n=1 Tax=Eucalyptus grandis TaxID=71139 RepID=UPI00192F1034|nr:acyl-CoA-binding domain-containing protein 3 [Eucalyptus grandis]